MFKPYARLATVLSAGVLLAAAVEASLPGNEKEQGSFFGFFSTIWSLRFLELESFEYVGPYEKTFLNIISYHIVSYRIISYHIVSYRIIYLYLTIPSEAISYRMIEHHIVSYDLICYHMNV